MICLVIEDSLDAFGAGAELDGARLLRELHGGEVGELAQAREPAGLVEQQPRYGWCDAPQTRKRAAQKRLAQWGASSGFKRRRERAECDRMWWRLHLQTAAMLPRRVCLRRPVPLREGH